MFQANAQTCQPDPVAADTLMGLDIISPLPYDDTAMTGGIETSACINKPYEHIFTIKIPAEVPFGPIALGVDSMSIPTTSGLSGLPVGMTYACNPPNCIFQVDEPSCLVVYGTADDTNAAGDYSLTLDITIYSPALGPVPLTEPGGQIPGSYTVVLEDENSPNCFVVGTDDVFASSLDIKNVPNPFSTYTQIQVLSGIQQDIQFEVYDVIGNRLHSQSIALAEGENFIDFDGSNLPNGMYVYSLKNGDRIISKRMVVSK